MLLPQKLRRRWTSVTACPIMPWPGWLLSPWPPLLISPVFTHPLDAKTAAGGGKVMGGGDAWGRAWGGSVQSTLEEVSGHVPRGLPGFIWPLIPSLMLCPELFHYGIRGSVSTPHLFPSSLMTSVPDPRTDPSLCPGKSVSSYSGQGEGLGGCTVLLVGLHHSALFICVIIFLKNCITCGCHPLPQPWVQSVFQACLHLTWLFQGPLSFVPTLVVRPSQQRPRPSSLPKALVYGGKEGDLSVGSLSPEPWGRGPCTTFPCLPSTRLKAQSSQTC